MKHVIRNLLTLTFAVSISLVSMAQTNERSDSLFYLGQQKKKAKQYKEALTFFTEALVIDARNVHYLTQRGSTYLYTEQYSEGLTDLNRALMYQPNYDKALAEKASFFAGVGMFKDALTYSNLTMEYATSDSLYFVGLKARADAYMLEKQYVQAVNDFKQYLSEYDSLNISAITYMGIASYRIHQTEEEAQKAIALFKKAARLDSADALILSNLAYFLSKEKVYDEALIAVNKALSIDNSFYRAYNNRGYIRLKMGDTKGAMEDIKASIGINNKNPYAYKNRGEVYVVMEEIDKACRDFKKAIDYGFSEMFGNEAQVLYNTHCTEQQAIEEATQEMLQNK